MFTGLDNEANMLHIAADLKDLIEANSVEYRRPGIDKPSKRIPEENLHTFLEGVYQAFDRHFKLCGHPIPKLSWEWSGPKDNGTCATFDFTSWCVYVNPELASLAPKCGYWTRLQAAVFSKTLYHEMRHAEQHCLVIRYVWHLHPAARAGHLQQRSLTNLSSSLTPPLPTIAVLENVAFEPDKNVSRKDFQLAGVLFQSLYRTFAMQALPRRAITNPISEIETHETAAANLALAAADVYANAVDDELKSWNQAKPTGWIGTAIQMRFQSGQELMKLIGDTKNPKFLKAGYAYLCERRQYARNMLKYAQEEYEGVPLEADAFAVERKLAGALRLGENQTDKLLSNLGVLKSTYLPEPVRWTPDVPLRSDLLNKN